MGFFKKIWGGVKKGVEKAAKKGLNVGRTLYNNRDKYLNVADKVLGAAEAASTVIPGVGLAGAASLEGLRRGLNKANDYSHKAGKIVDKVEESTGLDITGKKPAKIPIVTDSSGNSTHVDAAADSTRRIESNREDTNQAVITRSSNPTFRTSSSPSVNMVQEEDSAYSEPSAKRAKVNKLADLF
jgi:hypothetical protein